MVQRSKGCHNEVIITSLLGVLKRPLKDIPVVPLFIDFMVPDNLCNKAASWKISLLHVFMYVLNDVTLYK